MTSSPTGVQRRSAGADLVADTGCGEGGPHRDASNHVSRLYREQAPRLLRRLTRETGCPDTALDIAQEAFAKLLQIGPARIFRIDRPDAFLRRLAINLVHDRGRARAVAARGAALLAQDSEVLDQVAVLESRDRLRRLEKAMAGLKPKTRRIFLAHRLDGLSYAEIATETGLSIKGVEKQMSKAIAKIDRLLERD